MKEEPTATCLSPPNPLKGVDTWDVRDDPQLETIQLGVWTLTLGKARTKAKSRWPFISQAALRSRLALVRRIFSEVWRVDPWAVAFLALYHFFEAIEYSIILYFSGRLLKQSLYCHTTMPKLESRVIRHFKTNLLSAMLRADLPTSLRPSTTGRVSASSVWDTFCQVFHLCASILNVASIMTFIIASCRSAVGVGPVSPLICLVEPVLLQLERRPLWPIPHVVHTENEVYLRAKRLSKMAKQELHEEVISAGIGEYIIEELKKACAHLRDTSTEEVNRQYDQRATPIFNILCKVSGDLPIVYCVLCAIYSTGNLSVASIAMLEQGASNFRAMVWVSLRYIQRFGDYARVIEQYYKTIEAPEKENLLAEGQLQYPCPSSSEAGMSFNIRDVTFAYPGSLDRPSLRNINVDIKPGQLVVIVGANGSIP
ncbi:hypothetical protein K523DRAFT_352289 [Schizophyllum commune Tattone D]|nr:hypothetical protein K523DRAFT_352289 [Schizophyllum commune Tattone D]